MRNNSAKNKIKRTILFLKISKFLLHFPVLRNSAYYYVSKALDQISSITKDKLANDIKN